MTEPEAWAAHLPPHEEIAPMDKIDTITALLPCPFCGGDLPYTDEESCRIFGKRTGHNFAVACSSCEVSAPGAHTIDEAIAAWNSRALVPALSELACEIGQRISAANDRAQLAEVQDFPDRKSMSKRIGEQRKLIRKLQILADGRLKRIEQLQDNVRQANDRADRAEAERAAQIEADAGVRKRVATAIFDPGVTEGYKGDRTLTEWQVDAVMRAILSQPHDRSALDRMLADAEAKALRRAGAAAYRVCAETRHVTLGRKVEASIEAMIPKEGA